MRLALVLLVTTMPLLAAVYVPPDQSKSLFKRDLLPLDTDTMRELSGHLTSLARRDIGQDPVHWRATAQLLAIATRLDPANRPARDLGTRLAAGDVRPPPTGIDFGPARDRTWTIVDWLLQPEAGDEGQLLGHQLLDAMRVVDPRHPLARRHHADGEAARWRGIVADLDRFQAAPPTSPADPPDEGVPCPPPPPPQVRRPPIKLREASLATPLFLYDNELRMQLQLTRLSMRIEETPTQAPLSFTLTPELAGPLLETSRQRVRASLERTWPDLPLGANALLDTGEWRYASRNGTALTGPVSLLLHAALDGSPLRSDLVLLSDLKDDGSLARPTWSWDYLITLRHAEGGRLLVPPDLQPELRAMIALESPEFFRRWEVLVVSSLDAALAIGRAEGSPEGLAEASGLFAEFQEFARNKAIGPLCVNENVRRGLADILAKAPYHFSAAMLLLQGELNRPTRLDREVTARLLRSAVEPLVPLAKAPLANLNPNRADAAFDAARSRIAPFTKYLRPEDEDLLKAAMELTSLTRSIGRGLQVGRRDAKGNIIARTGVPVAQTHGQLQAELDRYLATLAPFTGEEPPPPAAPPAP